MINGGVAPTFPQVLAMNNFARGMRQDFIWSKMKSVVLFLNNGLVGCGTPLLVGTGGSDPWNLSTFIAGDLTANGLIGDGASKNIKTVLLPSTLFSSDGNAGYSIYVSTTVSNVNQYDLGMFNPADGSNCFTCNSDTTTQWQSDCWDNITANRGENYGAVRGVGFFSFNRTSTTNVKMYFAKTTTAWAQVGTSDGTVCTSTRGWANNQFNTGIIIFGLASTNGTIFNFSARRYSYISFHDGLTSAEGQMEFNRVQTFRLAVGGGTA